MGMKIQKALVGMKIQTTLLLSLMSRCQFPIDYIATNYVGDRSAITQDMQEIDSPLNENNADGADLIYHDGVGSI